MKTYNLRKIFVLLPLFLLACQDEILDKNPLDRYSDVAVWADINLADAYLLDNYDFLGVGFSQVMLTAVSDETRFTHNLGTETYVQGLISADDTRPWNVATDPRQPWEGGIPGWSMYFNTIQSLNKFLANIDQVVNAYAEAQQATIRQRADVMKGEALFMRAFCYAELARTYGGVPIIAEQITLGDDFLSIPRATFQETIQFISDDCDAAAALLLSKDEMIMGRATNAAALALKSRIWLFAASDLTADGTAEDAYVGYENPDRTALWTNAKNAAKAVMDLGTYTLADFGAPDQAAVAQNYFAFFKANDLSSSEVIWGKMYSRTGGIQNQMNQWNDSNGLTGWSGNGPTQGMVDSYQMEDGSDFSAHFAVDADGYYRNISSTYADENPYHHREPRFYGSILYDSAVWQPRRADLATRDPLGIYDRRTRVTIENGTEVSRLFGIDTRQSDYNSFNAGYTGYLVKKMLDDQVTVGLENNENAWIEFRYAEILLNYAEACAALGETAEATTYINQIRNRVALPNVTGDITTALRHERQIELAFESKRWYDIRRWHMLEQKLTDAMGIDITETHQDGSVTTTWKQIVAQPRTALPKMYWIPISTDELNRAPQLVQNPGY